MAKKRGLKPKNTMPQKALLTLPAHIKTLRSLSDDVDSSTKGAATVLILVDTSIDKRLIAYARRLLRPQTRGVRVFVRSYSDELPDVLDRPVPEQIAEPPISLALVLAAKSSITGKVIKAARRCAGAVATIATAPAELINQLDEKDILKQVEDIVPIDFSGYPVTSESSYEEHSFGAGSTAAAQVSQVAALCDAAFNELAEWIAYKLEDKRITLAQAYPFLRRAVALELSRKASLENALVAAVSFIPGIDVTVLIANQMRLVIQIAALYNLPLGLARIKEIAILVAGGFGCRALVRMIVKKLPCGAFMVKMAVSYITTFATGMAVLEFYEKQQGDFAEVGNEIAQRGRQLAARIKALPAAKRSVNFEETPS